MFQQLPSTVAESLATVRYHYQADNIHWITTIFMTFVHLGALTGIWHLTSCTKETLLFTFYTAVFSGFGITVGAHRLWAHRTYVASWPVRFFLMLVNSTVYQGSIYKWAKDHRVHHSHAETIADPHDAGRGFFFAHMGWMFVNRTPEMIAAGRAVDISDLRADWIVMLQKRSDPWFGLYMTLVFPMQLVVRYCGETKFNGFFVACCLRYVYMLHATWMVNSAAHLWGDHPYDPMSYATENPFVSFLTGGEGWHNYHHKYPYDYACSEFGVSAQFNPSKLFIDFMAKLGLVWGRRRAQSAWELNRKRRDLDDTAGVVVPVLAARPWHIAASNSSPVANVECNGEKGGRKHDEEKEDETTASLSSSSSSVSLESDGVAAVGAIVN